MPWLTAHGVFGMARTTGTRSPNHCSSAGSATPAAIETTTEPRPTAPASASARATGGRVLGLSERITRSAPVAAATLSVVTAMPS
jgi:hypothetical protein